MAGILMLAGGFLILAGFVVGIIALTPGAADARALYTLLALGVMALGLGGAWLANRLDPHLLDDVRSRD